MMGNRKKTSIESTSIDSEENFEVGAHLPGQNFQCLTEENQRRSTRRRQHVTYCDNLSDEDEEEDVSKRFKGVGYPSPTKESEVHAATPNGEEKKLKNNLSSEESLQNTEQEAETPKRSVDLSSDVGPETFESAYPDFSDFEKDKDESCFKVGQVWAVYDTLDAMPRYYAVIRKILSPAFKLSSTWLEPEPRNEDETKWLSEGFPASCGRFRLGDSEYIEDHLMFSHLACDTNGNIYDAIKIFPLKGETWAIFKDWDMNWCSHLQSNKKFNYEFVELLSDYANAIGVTVAYLGKANGFTCLFHRTGDPFLVPPKDLLRFSHRVPCFKMTGMERNDVPEGSFELDPASLPTDQVPEPEFYRFAAERSPDKFQIGQCWAIYNDEDALPRYYGQIKKIDLLPEFVLHVAWFYACLLPKSTIKWHDKTMSIGCGLFKFRNNKLNKYTETNNFSHVVAAEPLKKGVYKIFPGKGEVWAVYKNWNAQLKGNNLEDFEYEIVEIVDVSDEYVDVKFLMWVKGFKSVHKRRVEEEEEADGVVKIYVSEHIIFSHQIPAFRLTEERGGSLRGFWVLDPAAMPLYLLCTD